MGSIKNRLRGRRNGFVQKMETVDLTDESTVVAQKFVEVIDLTDSNIKTEAVLEPERLVDFRQRIFAVMQNGKNQSMSLLRLVRRVNAGNVKRFSKIEIDWALLQMEIADEIYISSNGLVYGLVTTRCSCKKLRISE